MIVSLQTPHLMSITETIESNQWGLDLGTSQKRIIVTSVKPTENHFPTDTTIALHTEHQDRYLQAPLQSVEPT